MPAVHRAGNLRFVVFLDDHGPPHVHVFRRAARQSCCSAKPTVGRHSSEPGEWIALRRAMAETLAHRGELLPGVVCTVPTARKRTEIMASGWSKSEMDKEIDRALERGRRLARGEPRAASARYDRRTRRMVVELTNGCSFVFPPRALQGMARASDTALADVEILGQGHALHWPQLDADFTVPGLLMGVFGTRAWMASELARRAGQAKSPAKAAAARANGRKGGRPRRKAA
jgi:hypothetical protein